jgi:hypothetical protein
VIVVIGALPYLGGLYYMQGNLRRIITGANDDYVGVVVRADRAQASLGITSSKAYVLINGVNKAGELILVMRN